MIPVPSGVRVWLATGHTDMRKGFASLSLQVQEILRRDPLSGQLFCFRGRRGDLLKVIWHDGQGEHTHRECSAFVQHAGRWYFIDPTVPLKAGRNDPCPCGSGEKFKKCCAAYL